MDLEYENIFNSDNETKIKIETKILSQHSRKWNKEKDCQLNLSKKKSGKFSDEEI